MEIFCVRKSYLMEGLYLHFLSMTCNFHAVFFDVDKYLYKYAYVYMRVYIYKTLLKKWKGT